MTPKQIKAARDSLGYTQQEMADVLGLSRQQINNLEKGVHPIRRVVELAVAQILAEAASDEQHN